MEAVDAFTEAVEASVEGTSKHSWKYAMEVPMDASIACHM